jgi:peptidoglycan glycosyltransferase
MKEQRIYIKVVALLLLGLLLLLTLYGGYAISTYGNRWFASYRNPRIRMERGNVIAGSILDRNDLVLAATSDGQRIYQTNEASRRAMVHILGDSQGNIANGVETFQAGLLLGFERSLAEQITQMVRSEPKKGDNLYLTVDSKVCVEAVNAFQDFHNTQGKRGAAVVMNYQTGEVLCMISLPDFDPHKITEATRNDEAQPFWNRAVQSVYPPGSTFKIVTALGALRNIHDSLTKLYNCDGALTVLGSVITDAGNAHHGSLPLSRAFTLSCNNTFAQIALEIGDDHLRKAAESFGFNDNFLFRDLVVENSRYPTVNRNQLEVAWSGAGQSQIGATPLHMCMIAAGIANQGLMMEPALIQKAVSDNGVIRYAFTPREYRRVVTADEAALIKGLMLDVVRQGTGTRAQVKGVAVCGKTGSAESSMNNRPVTHGWFVGFIDDERYPYAISVIVESVNDGDGGGTTAAPIAQKILAYICADKRFAVSE